MAKAGRRARARDVRANRVNSVSSAPTETSSDDEGVEQAFGLRNFRISGLSPTDGYATEDDLSCAILSALSRPLPAPAINAFLRLPAPTRAEFLEGRGLDEDLALDELCQLGLKDLLPPTREAHVVSFDDDCLVLNIAYL